MWLIFALLCAVSQTAQDFLVKAHGRANAAVLGWGATGASGLFMLLIAARAADWTLAPAYWTALPVSASLNSFAFFLYFRTIQRYDLSLSMPMLAFTPLFMIVTSPLIVGEHPSFLGVVGILLIVAGSYGLKAAERNKGALAPFRALAAAPGPRAMLMVSLIWSITSNIDRIGINASSKTLWLASVFLSIFTILSPWALLRLRRGEAGGHWLRGALLVGLLLATTAMLQMTAIMMGPVPYVMAVKRLSVVFAVLVGWLAYREGDVRSRLAGAAVMAAGVFCIAAG